MNVERETCSRDRVADRHGRPGTVGQLGGDHTGRPVGKLAFTLVELLAVIAVLAILAALLLPSVSRAKARGQRTYCQNNLRQLAVALTMYADDYDRYPPAFRHIPDSGVSLWNAHVLEYVSGSREVFNCPSYPPHYRWTTARSGVGLPFPMNIQGNRPFCYGINVFGAQGLGVSTAGALGLMLDFETGRKPSELRSPADLIALGEEPLQRPLIYGKSNKVGGWGVLHAYAAIGQPEGYLHTGTVHGDGSNMAFVDSHVEWAKWWKWVEASERATRRWNYDHEPHPEFWRR
jgi:prepilin-type N-terminal cleavage/methylation domain-containing protein/prepilin-type processing-associated H-X9-DG protein